MQPFTIIHDCDHFMQDGYIETIKVWHEPFGNPLQLDKVCGHDFFRWLPAETRGGHKLLLDWWDANCDKRNEQVAEYLIARAGIRESEAIPA